MLTFYLTLSDAYMPLEKILRNFYLHLIIQYNLLLYLLTFNRSNKKNKNN